MHAFDVLGDPVRRRVIELLGDGELPAGAVAETVMAEFGISQPAVSQHLRVLREHGFASVRPDGTRRLYALRPEPLQEVDAWLDGFRRAWQPRLDALATEVARGKRSRRASPRPPDDPTGTPEDPTSTSSSTSSDTRTGTSTDQPTDQRGAHP